VIGLRTTVPRLGRERVAPPLAWIHRISRELWGEATRSTRRLETWTIRASDCSVVVADQQRRAVERLFGAVVLRLEIRTLPEASR
jgi:hypothetical protein